MIPKSRHYIGANLKRLCEERSLSLYQLSSQLQIPSNTIYKIGYNEFTATSDLIQKVAAFFNVAPDSLIDSERGVGRVKNGNSKSAYFIGRSLSKIMVDQSLETGEVAGVASLHSSEISALKLNRKRARLPTIEKIAAAIGISAQELIDRPSEAKSLKQTKSFKPVKDNDKIVNGLDEEDVAFLNKLTELLLLKKKLKNL